MPIIEVNHVTKEYQLGTMQSLKTTELNQWRRLTGQPVEEQAPFKALDDASFNIEADEVVGIIGYNGTDKSTMLKLLDNISKLSSDSIQVKGSGALRHRTIRQDWWRMPPWCARNLVGISGMPNLRQSCATHGRGGKADERWIQ